MNKEDRYIIDQAFETDDISELERLVKKAESIIAKTIIREFIEELQTENGYEK